MSSRKIRNPAAYKAAVARNKLYGHGDYSKKKPKKTVRAPRAKKSGNSRSMSMGQRIGAHVGGLAQNVIKKLTGFGDYKETGRPLNMGGEVPQFANAGGAGQAGSIRVQHREYIQDIQGSTGFQIQSFVLNPGLNDTFPWLDAVAANFEQYCIRGMAFVYKATCATAVASTNTALGTVIMATQYNANAAPFQNKQQMENYQFAQSGVPFNDITHYIECAKSQTSVSNLYVRTGSVPSGQDARLYDMGVFYLATTGMQAASTIGELWVTYDIELLKPRIISGSGGNNVLSDHFNLGTSPTAGAWFGVGTSLLPTPSSNLGGVITANASTNLDTYTFPAMVSSGTYLLFYRVLGVSTVLTNQLVIGSIGANIQVAPPIFINGTTANIQAANGETSTMQWRMSVLRFVGSAPNQSFIRFTAGTLPAAVTSGEFVMTQLNPLQVDMGDSKYDEKHIKSAVDAYLKQKGLSTYDIDAIAENLNNVDRTLGLPEVQPEPEPDPPVELKEVNPLFLQRQQGNGKVRLPPIAAEQLSQSSQQPVAVTPTQGKVLAPVPPVKTGYFY